MKSNAHNINWVMAVLLIASFSMTQFLTACVSTPGNAEATQYYFLRHAEINKKDPDKPLTDKGKQRAQVLVEQFRNSGITQIYATHTDRTYNTVAPLSERLNIAIVQVPKQGQTITDKTVTNRSKGKIAIKPMVKALKKVSAGNRAVVAANSGNLFAIMAGIGVPVKGDAVCANQSENCLPCKSKKCFPGKEFNNIWSVTLGENGKVTLHRSKYGD